MTASHLPLVSIVTATYNAAPTIEQTILSVEAQTYKNIEHIIIDGMSSDDTSSIVNDYLHSKNRKYIREPDSGLYDAMNKGIRASRGKFVIILNADDRFHPTAIEVLVNQSIKHNSDSVVVSSTAQYVDKHKRLHKTPKYKICDHIYLRMPLRHGTMLVPKLLYDKFGLYDLKYKISADHEYSIRLYEQGVKFFVIDKPLLYFDHGGVSGKVSDMLINDRINIICKYFPNDPDYIVKSLANDLSSENIQKVLDEGTSPKLASALRSYSEIPRPRTQVDTTRLFAKFWQYQKLKKSQFILAPSVAALNIATICTTTNGGAGKGSLRRVDALRTAGLNVNIVTLRRSEVMPHIKQIFSDQLFKQRWSEYIDDAIKPVKSVSGYTASEMFAINKCILLPSTLNQILGNYDLLHFHWTNGLLDYSNPEAYDWLDKPIVWTFADMHHFTGGCHYSEGCDQFRNGCNSCPLVGDSVRPSVASSQQDKKKFFANINNLTIIYPSEWLKDLGMQSDVLPKHANHVHIPNPFPFHEFSPIESSRDREELTGVSFDSNQMVLLIGADSLANRRKGMWIFVNALELLADKLSHTDLVVCTFGHPFEDKLPFPVLNFGMVDSKYMLSRLYSSVDFFVFPSLEDNAPLTVAESLACGTPVIASRVGNVPQLIQDGFNGYVFEAGSASALADKLIKAHESLSYWQSDRINIRKKCWKRVKAYNSPLKSINAHIDLYSTISVG